MRKSILDRIKGSIQNEFLSEFDTKGLNTQKIEEGINKIYKEGFNLPFPKIIYTKNPAEMYEKTIDLILSFKQIGKLIPYNSLLRDIYYSVQTTLLDDYYRRKKKESMFHKDEFLQSLRNDFRNDFRNEVSKINKFILPLSNFRLRGEIQSSLLSPYGVLKYSVYNARDYDTIFSNWNSFLFWQYLHLETNQNQTTPLSFIGNLPWERRSQFWGALLNPISKLASVYDGLFFDNYVIVCGYPKKVNLNENNQLHCDGYPTIEWEGDCKFWYLNGVAVSQELAETPSSLLDVDMFLKEKNADIRAQFILKYGIERLIKYGKIIDSFKNYDSLNEEWRKSEYELLDMSAIMPQEKQAMYLKMKNQTIPEIYHLEGVSNECQTIQDAIRFRLGELDEYETIAIK